MAVKREKVHFETVEELLGAPIEKDATTEVRIDQIFPFENHPFKVLDDDKMEDLVQSIKDNGVLTPVLLRPDDEGTYEMILDIVECMQQSWQGLLLSQQS